MENESGSLHMQGATFSDLIHNKTIIIVKHSACCRLGVVWFGLASLVVIWDALFVLLRPRSMSGGDLHHFWKPCSLT